VTLDAYDELCAWTLSLGDREFVHQHVVDAHMLQTTSPETKPIGVVFALVGLYLQLERGFTGREVQLVHMKLGRGGGPWPTFDAPEARGRVTPAEVLATAAGPARIDAIRAWCASVWEPWSAQRELVEGFLRERHMIP
jgi:hypothetical protein